jgi:enterochelin esterase-like enzyme
MKQFVFCFAFWLNTGLLFAQDFTTTIRSLYDTSKSAKVFQTLVDEKKIPFIVQDSVAFLYKGEANTVAWMGDFNGWGYDANFPNKGKKIPHTNIWLLKASFPKDARLDYKIVLNGDSYILDPENPYQQWSGVGGGSPNSELRMPDWKEDEKLVSKNSPKGKLKTDVLLNSKVLGYQIMYSIYLPAGYESLGKLPVAYVTDGYEYMHPQMGNMPTVLDNLIADKKIEPIIAVFVDNREPINRQNNRRMKELAMSAAYLDFFVKELIPEIEKRYPAVADPKKRAIIGTSMGGLTATYFAFTRPDVFGLAGIQSPAFWTKPQIYQLCNNPANATMKISMTTGLINDTSKESRKMKDILEANSCQYHYREVNEGHSWGNWRNLIDDVLMDLLPRN